MTKIKEILSYKG